MNLVDWKESGANIILNLPFNLSFSTTFFPFDLLLFVLRVLCDTLAELNLARISRRAVLLLIGALLDLWFGGGDQEVGSYQSNFVGLAKTSCANDVDDLGISPDILFVE